MVSHVSLLGLFTGYYLFISLLLSESHCSSHVSLDIIYLYFYKGRYYSHVYLLYSEECDLDIFIVEDRQSSDWISDLV